MELIEVDNLRDDILNNSDYDNDTINHFLYLVDSQPIVDAEPVLRAKWKKSDAIQGLMACENCRCQRNPNFKIGFGGWNYCPNCGAKMEEFNE